MATTRPSITFGTDGWRGIIADDFTGSNVRLVAQAIANYFDREDVPGDRLFFVGYDNRSQSEYFALEAAKVAAAAGFKTFLSKTSCSSPAVSLNCHVHNAKGGIMITASHNPPQFNGLKIKMGYGGSSLPSVVAGVEHELKSLMDAGTLTVDVPADAEQNIQRIDFSPPYLDTLRKLVDLEVIGKSGYKIIADSMHGSGAGYLMELLRGYGADVTEIRGERNPVFGGVNPEPITQNLQPLSRAILEHGADVGVAIDGDADRVGAMDSRGDFVDSQRVFALLLRHLYEDKGQRGSVVKTVSVTKLVDKLCAKYGLTLHIVPIGFKNVCEYMLKEPVLIGGEESGGLGVLGFIPERDGPLMSLLLLESMAVRKKRLEEQIDELMEEFGNYEYSRADLRPDATKMTAIAHSLRNEDPAELAGMPVSGIDRMDGTKFLFADDSWLLLRPSGTEPVVRVYAEASTKEKVQALIEAGTGLVFQV